MLGFVGSVRKTDAPLGQVVSSNLSKSPRRDPAPQPVTDKNVRRAAPSREVNFPQRVGVCAYYTNNRRSDRASGGQLRSDRSRSAGKSVDFCSRLLDVLHKSGLSPQETRSPGAVKPSGGSFMRSRSDRRAVPACIYRSCSGCTLQASCIQDPTVTRQKSWNAF